MRRLFAPRRVFIGPQGCICTRSTFFWKWGGNDAATADKKKKEAVAAQNAAALQKKAALQAQGGKKAGTFTTVADMYADAKLAASLANQKDAESSDSSAAPAPTTEQQRLIDAGLRLLEYSRSSLFDDAEVALLEAVTDMVFSESACGLSVPEQLQVFADAVFVLSSGGHADACRMVLVAAGASLPPPVSVLLSNVHFPTALPEETERAGFVAVLRFVLGDDLDTCLCAACAGVEGYVGDEEDEPVLIRSLRAAGRGKNPSTAVVAMVNTLAAACPALAAEGAFQTFITDDSPTQLRVSAEYASLLGRLFLAFDPAGTGRVSVAELRESLSRVLGGGAKEASSLLDGVPVDADGTVDYGRLLKVIREGGRRVPTA